ncbi:hypothetical protein BBOV_III001800 [Babesia bovis T2Bo]|uniref:hypothetical protein n=1 Tax=Babesia bovis T2Bo TaxID=484906 RepID=UPI001C36842A|nr:hypothetical protein BBOV_III001800 [Babesia bovis T2Bo]EDO07747.2 hypothetical protein BBOV_III001800 [Babesia bovis T2Bo]
MNHWNSLSHPRNPRIPKDTRWCIYDLRCSPRGPVFCAGTLRNNTGSTAGAINPTMSLYVGSVTHQFHIMRRISWSEGKLQLDSITKAFFYTLSGPRINKVVYNDSVDLACWLGYNCNVTFRNVLDLCYMYVTQSENIHVTNSYSMIKEMLDHSVEAQQKTRYLNSFAGNNARYHLLMFNQLVRYLLDKHGHPESAWKTNIHQMIESLAQGYHCYHMQSADGGITVGEYTPSDFKGQLEATIDLIVVKPTRAINILDHSPVLAILKQKSYVDRTALLNTGMFVVSPLDNVVHPLYALVAPDLFYQFSDVEVGEAIQVIPIKEPSGIVKLYNIYDRFCCYVERQHGNTLFYDIRLRKLVPRITRPR